MKTTRVFKSGNSQAVRIPQEFQFDSKEVQIFKRNDEVVICNIPKNLAPAFKILTDFPGDFMEGGRDDPPPQDRNFD